MVGAEAAAPVMFDIFEQLPNTDWFEQPFDDMVEIEVCTKSGYRAGPGCEIKKEWAPQGGLLAPVCAYHKLIHLDQAGKYRVNSGCYEPDKMQHRYWFVLSPVEEFFYKNIHPDYFPCQLFKFRPRSKNLEEGSLRSSFIQEILWKYMYPKHWTVKRKQSLKPRIEMKRLPSFGTSISNTSEKPNIFTI
ncbi:MAG: hypothetical protein R2879_02240 [Saprospiraceae bacterium]